MRAKVARILSLVSAALAGLLLLRPRNGFLAAALWFPKAAVGAWAPVLALTSGLGVLLSLLRRKRAGPLGHRGPWNALAVGGGLFGVVVTARYTARVTAHHTAFDEAFGPNWQSRIPLNLRPRLLPRRYTPLLMPTAQVRVHRNIVYAIHPENGRSLVADLWLPPAGVPRTGLAVLYLFGGAWHYMHRDLWTGHVLRHLAVQGHVVMNADYTLAPEADPEGMVADVKRAIAWLKRNAPEYEVDPMRIVLMGCSSGAHLALLAAYTPGQSAFQPANVEVDLSVRAVISDSGFADLHSSYAYFREKFGAYLKGTMPAERWFLAIMGWAFRRARLLPPGGRMVVPRDLIPSLLRGTPAQVPEKYWLGSPISYAGPHCPPTLLLQGGHDYCGIQPGVQRLHRALRQAGVPVVCVEYAGAEHSFPLITAGAFRWAPAIQAALYDVERFLALMV